MMFEEEKKGKLLKLIRRHHSERRTMHYGSRHAHIEDFFMLGVGAKCNELLIIYCIFFVFVGICGGGDVP